MGGFENERGTSSDRRTGEALFRTLFCIGGPSETIVFEAFGRLGDRPGDRQGDFKRFFEGVFESVRSTSSDRRTGRAPFWTWFCIVGSSETIVFKAFGRHRPPILEREAK